MKGRAILLLAAALLISAAAFPAVASAQHYYAVAQSISAPQNEGTECKMLVRDGTCSDWAAGGFIAQVLWEGTDNYANGQSWVELGYTRGWELQNILTFYWADQRPGSYYYEHQITSVTPHVGARYTLAIEYRGSNSWHVFINNSDKGTSSPNPPYSRFMETGMENTNGLNRMGSSSSPCDENGLIWQGTNGSWSMLWPSTTTLYSDFGFVVWWHAQDSDVMNYH
jgi:hypothetical protein